MPEQDRDDSDMDSLGLLMMLGCIAENIIFYYYIYKIIYYEKYFFFEIFQKDEILSR